MNIKVKNVKRTICIISILMIAIVTSSCSCCKEERATLELMKRVIPSYVDNFKLEKIETQEGLDVFEIDKSGKKVVIRGNSGVAMASGLNYYLENFCNAHISLNYNQLNLPKELPLPSELVRISTPFEYRYFFNYCTFGYTMPWWDWEKWEKITDYMALKGVNMPLAMIGQEAVWQRVYNELGVTNKQLESFFVGPAHLPWGWMGNIDGLAGPLPQKWIERRAELQKKILERQRSLGMKPVLQAFTGHVPKELSEIFPEAKIMQIADWAGIEGTYFLDPNDPLFARIGSLFIKYQTQMYGTDHLYDADCFIEVDPPSNDPDFLKKTAQTVYNSMAEVDKDAKWVIQGWFFFFKQNFWKKEQGEAFFDGIPKDRAIVLDLYGEKYPVWDKTDALFGQPWIWNVICNEDQKVNMSGNLDFMQHELSRAIEAEGANNLKGIGVIPEGIGYNPVVQDFIFGKAWDQKLVDVDSWISDYAKRRYGVDNEDAENGWKQFVATVYGRTRTMWSPITTPPQLLRYEGEKEDIRHDRAKINVTDKDVFAWDFDVFEFAKGAELLLDSSDELRSSEAYKFDLTNVFRELLHSFAHKRIYELSAAYDSKDIERFDLATANILKLFDDLNEVTSCNSNFMVGSWIEQARSWGDTQQEKEYFERNARTIISIWQPIERASLRDYAGRQWNGMLEEYYKPRWVLFTNMLRESLTKGGSFNRKTYNDLMYKMDYNWSKSSKRYPSQPYNDIIEVATRIWSEYSPELK